MCTQYNCEFRNIRGYCNLTGCVKAHIATQQIVQSYQEGNNNA